MAARAMMRPVGLKDRIARGAARAGELARDAADSAAVDRVRRSAVVEKVVDSTPVQSVGETYAGLKALFTDEDERELVIERTVVTLVRTVRDDDDEPLTDKDVLRAAKKRSRRARRTALLAGPMVGTANQIVDLYCETATVVDLDRLHGLGMSDERIAAQMLVLWDITPDIAIAEAAILGTGPSVKALLTRRFSQEATARMPETKTKTAMLKAIWKARSLAGGVREGVMGERNITGIVFAGKRVKEFIARAEAALGVA